jgi:hypothetical protein
LADTTLKPARQSGIRLIAKPEPGKLDHGRTQARVSAFRHTLIAVWYDLSDVRLAEALDDRASFRRFCGFSAHESTPERTAFVRFRKELVARGA